MINADRPRLLIADDVGVGKTIEAGLIIKELQARQKLDSVLVICPKQLVVEGKWRQELKRFDEDFVELDSQALQYCLDETRREGEWPGRYRKAILPYSLLDERLLLGEDRGRRKRPGLLSLLPPVKFDLVIVDEAHHVRNRDTWRHRVVDHLLGSAEAAVLISATPIQTGSADLFNLLYLLRPDVLTGPGEFDRMREPNRFIAAAEAIARKGAVGWQAGALKELEHALATTWGTAVLAADLRARQVRDLLETNKPAEKARVRAVRSLQALNTLSGLINRTRRRDIGSLTVRKPETVEVDFTPEQEAVHADILDLCARIVGSRRRGLSTEFLLSTLRRQASSSLNGLAPFVSDLLEGRLSTEELSEADIEGEGFTVDEITEFRAEIRALADRAGALTEDPKLDALFSIIEEKQGLPNNKLLVFSTFRHTLAYLLPRIQTAGARVGLVHGGVPDHERRDIRARFALDKSDPDALDVLLSSEVGTEGLDNQFCDALVNYDIPWNPMRIEQRIGRIDRRGQRSESVSVKNLVVTGTVDAAIYERCLIRIDIFRQSLGASEEILGELTREMRAIADDLSLTPQERDAKLQQLADNKLARIQEQNELEDREASLFGLAIQKLDDDGVAAAASPWLSATQLAGLVSRYLADLGYERAATLFDRPVTTLRPDKALRAALLRDTRVLEAGGATVARWTRWLESPGEGTRRLTFDPKLADKDDVELLSPTHPLVRAAAQQAGDLAGVPDVSLVVSSTELPAGRYPFAVFAWTTFGVRDDYDIKVATNSAASDDTIGQLLLSAEQGTVSLTPAEAESLDAAHYAQWAQTKGEHIQRTEAHVAAQLASLKLSHAARVAQLQDQLAEATHPNIARMREGQLRSAEEDFARRSAELRQAAKRCGVTTDLLCRGVLEVR
jgi:superfamily II DNA or RNA helicase